MVSQIKAADFELSKEPDSEALAADTGSTVIVVVVGITF